MEGRKAFTLIELLVCVAITAVLAAILLPVVTRVRGVAINTVCTSRLRDLVVACGAYRIDFQTYPKLGPGRETSPTAIAALLKVPQPQEMDVPFVNGLAKYLNLPPVPRDADASDVPPPLECPMAEAAEPEVRNTYRPALPSTPTFYTGYVYVGRVDEQPASLPTGRRIELLRPDRAATRKNVSAVLWADDVHWTLTGSGPAWMYGHRRPVTVVHPGPLALTLDSPAALAGQHRAFADGHVEWVTYDDMKAGLLDPIQSRGVVPRDRGAALRIEPIYYLWF